jgi:N-acetylmuramoyl-L-alanine amidase CwlA
MRMAVLHISITSTINMGSGVDGYISYSENNKKFMSDIYRFKFKKSYFHN